MKRYPLTCLRTAGLKKILDIFSNFEIMALFSQRCSLQDKKTDILSEIGAKFSNKINNSMYLHIDKNCQPIQLKVYKEKLFKKLKEYALYDSIVNKVTVVFPSKELKSDCNKEGIDCGNDERFVATFVNIICNEEKLEEEYDKIEYNEYLNQVKGGLGLPKTIMIITKLIPYHQFITTEEKNKQYLINLHPNWRYHDNMIYLKNYNIPYTIRNIFGNDMSFVATFEKKKSIYLEVVKID